MADFGYDVAGESITLFLAHEVHIYDAIDKKNKEVNLLINKMEELEAFLGLVASRTDTSNRVDLTTAEDQAMVDRLRQHDDLRHIFPVGKYSWKDAEIENVSRMINQHIEGPLQRKMNMLTEEMALDQHEMTKALEMFKGGVTRCGNLNDRIISNTAKAN